MPVVDASELTKRRQGRVLYVNYLVRNNNVNVNQSQIARPLATGSPIGSGSGVNYANYIEEVVQGGFQTTPAEQQEIINRNFPPPPPPEVNSVWSYYIVYEGATTYMYLIYNSTTSSWYAPLDTGLSWDEGGYYTYDDWWYPTGFAYQFEKQDYSEYVYQFVDFDVGVIKQTLTLPEENHCGFDFSNDMVMLYYPDTDPSNTLITFYNPITDVFKTTSILGYVDDTESLNTNIYFVITEDDTNYTHYIWNIDQPNPVQIATSMGSYTNRSLNYGDNYILIVSSDGAYWTDIYYINLDGSFVNYSLNTSPLSSSDYPNDSYINTYTYAYKYKYIRLTLYNSTTSTLDINSYDYLSFNNLTPQMTTLSPVIISDIIGDTNPITNYGDTYYLTGITNDIVLQTYYPRIDFIYDLPFNTLSPYYYGGNQCQIFIDGQNIPDLVTDNYERFYGEKQQLRLDDTNEATYYGFINGTPTTHPHSMMAFVSRASETNEADATIQILIKDNFNGAKQYDQYNNAVITYQTGDLSGTIYYAGNNGGTDEPSFYHVWFTVENHNWGTHISDMTFDRANNTTNSQLEANLTIYGYNFIVIHLFLSGISSGTGTEFTETDITNIVTAYVGAADFMSHPEDFYTIDVVRYRDWHNSHANEYVTGIYYSDFYDYTYNPTYTNPLSHSILWQNKLYYVADGSTDPYIIDISNNTYVNDDTLTINNVGLGLWQCTDTETQSRLVSPTTDIITYLFDVNRTVTDYNTDYYNRTMELTDNITWLNAILSLTNGIDAVYKIVNMNISTTLNDDIPDFEGDYIYSGKNALIYSPIAQTIYKLMNGAGEVLTGYSSFTTNSDNDFGNGDLIVLSGYNEQDPTKVLTTNSTSFSEFTIPFIIYDDRVQNANFMMITTHTDITNFKALVVDSSGNTYGPYDTGIVSDAWDINLRYTDKSFMLSLYDYNGGQGYTLMFMYDTKTFVFVTQPDLVMASIDDVRSTYPG